MSYSSRRRSLGQRTIASSYELEDKDTFDSFFEEENELFIQIDDDLLTFKQQPNFYQKQGFKKT